MIVTCQSCLKHYELDETRVKPSGSRVQCSQCKAIFTLYPPDKEPIVLDAAPPGETTPVTTTTQPFVATKTADEDEVPPEASSDEIHMDLPDSDDLPTAASEPTLAFEKEKDPDLADAEIESPKTLFTADDEDDFDLEIEETPNRRGCLPIILFLLLLPAVVYGALVLLDKKGVEMPWLKGLNLPYIGQSMDSVAKPAFEMITVANINSRFVRNREGQPLFVISGKLTNEGDTPQQVVQLKGTLFDEANVSLAEKTVVGGRFLSDLDLNTLDPEAIDAKLTATDAAPVIDAGASVPFMIVFFDLDDGLKEFSVKVTGSEPVS